VKTLRALVIGITFVSMQAAGNAAGLTIVTATAQQVNCAFEVDCTFTVASGQTNFAVPGALGTAQLQQRTFTAKLGQTLRHGFEFKLDLSQLVTLSDSTCFTGLEIDFGPIVKLQYNNTGPLDDVFQIVAAGEILLGSATQTDGVIAFTFQQLVCAGDGVIRGKSTVLFGMASASAPKLSSAKVFTTTADTLTVRAMLPAHH
jgi:hypothetical protein